LIVDLSLFIQKVNILVCLLLKTRKNQDMKKPLLLLLVFSLFSFSCSNDYASPELKFTEAEFNSLSGDNGKTYRVVEAENADDPNETSFGYFSCHLDDLYNFKSVDSFTITAGSRPCFYEEGPPIEGISTWHGYFPTTGDIEIQTQRHEQTGQEVFRLTYSLYLDSIEPDGRLVFLGREAHAGRVLVLEEIE